MSSAAPRTILHSAGVWRRITAAASTALEPSFAAVAYFGSKGDRLLPLREGSKLVVDASISAVNTGITDPRSLRRLHNRGVAVFSMPSLHAKALAFDSIGFVGSTNASANSANNLIEAALSTTSGKSIKAIRAFVDDLCTDCLDDEAFDWLESQYRPPKMPIPGIAKRPYRRLVTQIMPSDQQGYSGHQVQPTSGAWSAFFGVNIDDATVPTLRLRNIKTGTVIDRKVVRHALVMTIDIPEAVPGAILEVWQVGFDRYDYSVTTPNERGFRSLDKELINTPNPMRRTGRLWIVD